MVKSLRRRISLAIAGVFSVTAGATSIPSIAFAADYEDVTQDGAYVGRTFNADFDTMLEDFAAAAPTDATANYVSDGVLSVTYDGDLNSNTMDAAVYKVASGIASSTNAWPYQYLVYEMSSPDASAKLSELGVYLRELENKSFTEAPVPFDEDFLDASSATEIGAEKTKIVVDLKSYVTNAGLTTMDANGLAGYHLVALPGQTGTVVLHDVYLTNEPESEMSAQTNAILADFEKGQTAGDTDKYAPVIYWCGSEVGKIIPKHVILAENASYEFAAKSKEQTNVVVAAQTPGTATFDLTIGDVTKSWADLKGPDGAALPAVATDSYFKNVVVNLTESGFTEEKTAGDITVTAKGGELNLVNTFLTDMEVVNIPADKAFPILDTASASKLDDFTFGQTAITDNYDEMIKEEALADSQLAYRLSYANGAKLSAKDGVLTFDATEIGTGYINFKTQSTKTFENFQYFVLKMKAEGDANLSTFRFGLGKDGTMSGGPVWGNGGLKSGVKLPIAALGAPGYPYTKDGWQYVIVDLAQSGLTVGDTVDMYYSGAGKLSIDEMFYCNALSQPTREVVPHVINAAETVIDASASPVAYQPVWGGGNEIAPIGKRFLTFEAKSTGAATLNEFRFEFAGTAGVYWIGENAQGAALGMNGNRLPALTEAYQTYVVDLEKSGVTNYAAISKITLHATLAAGTVTVKNFGFTDEYKVQQSLTMFDTETPYTIPAGDGGHHYIGWFGGDVNNASKALPVMAITLKGNAAINDNQLRFELMSGMDKAIATLWWKENAQGTLRDLEGNLLGDIAQEYQTFYIDLGAYSSVGAFHIHSSKAASEGVLTIKDIKFLSYDKLGAADFVAPTFDTEKPVVTVTTAATAVAEDKITVTYTATDNVTAFADLTVESIAVTKNGNPVTLDAQNAFTAEEGTYVITVTVSDAEGNIGIGTKTVTVSAKPSPDPEVGGGCGCGGAIGAGSIAIGSVALLGAVGFMLARKRKHSDK